MSNKGVSTIIATILVLLIAMALAGTAYIYFTGIMTGRTGLTISLQDASCNGTAMTLVIVNDGTRVMADEDLKILVNNNLWTIDFNEAGNDNDYQVNPHDNIILIDTTAGRYVSGTEYTVKVSTGSNTQSQIVTCE